MKYGKDGWPKQRARDFVHYTPEELLLKEVIDIIDDLLHGMKGLPAEVQTSLDRVKARVDEVFNVVSAYKERISELEAELDSRDERIDELEYRLSCVGDADDPEGTPF